ncbi:MAG TPA: protein translocase subunit SecF, partial [Candidatus Moranbacteria bacterium]|nr:protein translocase subunit SecF [Candidatus Moranbacteria bacterium]
MYNIISKTKYAYIFSVTITVLSLMALFIWGLKFDIDFTGGTRMEFQFSQQLPSNDELTENLKELNLKSLIIQPSENNRLMLRYASEEDAVNQQVFETLSRKYEGMTQLRVDYIDASVSKELKSKSLWAIVWAVLGIMGYIAWAFRKVSRPVESWKYGLGAVVALVHDILITVGVFSVLGHFMGVEVGIPFIAALLTILGFSVHDTIVVYDRTRENLLRSSGKENFPDPNDRASLESDR